MQKQKSIKRENSKKENFKKHSGITLIALVITIIVLLILAGVALAALTGDSGILSNAEKAREQTQMSNIKEEAYLVKSEAYIECKKNGEDLTREKLLEELNKHFKGSTINGNAITTANGKYDIIVDGSLNITVEKHKEKVIAKGDVELDYTVSTINSGKQINLAIKLLGIPEWNSEELENDFLENQFLVGKTTEELMVIAGKLKTEGTDLTAEQIYDAMLKSELDGISYADFMADKDAIIEEKYGYKSADLFAKSLILEMAENNIGLDVGTMIPYSKKVVSELVGKDEPVIKETVEGYYNKEKTFDEIVADVYGTEGVTLDILVAQINAACYETNLLSREEIMLVVAASAYAETHPIVIEYPDASTEEINWYGDYDLTFTGYYTVSELGEYIIKVTGASGNTEEIVCTVGSIVLDKQEITKTIGRENATAKETITATLKNLDASKLTWTTSDENVAEIEGEGTTVDIIMKAGGDATITATCEDYTATCKVSVIDISAPNADVTFSTDYGTIEVIWLEETTNKVSSAPNSPANALTSGGESLIPVAFNTTTKEWDKLETTDNNNNNWYKYEAASQTRGADGKLVDNRASNWANAMTKNESYFVWIPRYAYRITYYESETSTTPTGYYDGLGMWRATDGAVKYALDEGIETVTHNGNKYIVHPAFMGIGSEDLGGGFGTDSNGITGFWVAKFEMAGTGATLNSTYGSASIGNQTRGEQYTSARQATYGYKGIHGSDGHTSFMNSHMMKNSEWGAVAYLTHSQYGRNGHEISINNNGETYYRGGGNETAYITNIVQSTTGNVYGIYDMSGNKYERTAAFNSTDTYSHFSTNGWTEATGLTTSSNSTKFATKYDNTTSSHNGNTVIYKYGKVGDATKEVNVGGNNKGTSKTTYYNWFSDYPYLASSYYPFFVRGGVYYDGSAAGVFYLGLDNGNDYGDNLVGFRSVLVQ